MKYSALAESKTSALLETFASEVHRAKENPDADAVHDLRVSIRRLSQALAMFDGVLPAAVRKRVQDSTGLILEAAGDVRDLDIARELVLHDSNDGLAVKLEHDRAKAADQLARQLSKCAPVAATSAWRAAVKAPKDTGDAAAKGRSMLAKGAKQLLSAGRREIEERATAKRYHRVRLAAKRFRYQVELFRDVGPKKADALLKSVQKLQSALGDLNDTVAARKLLRDYSGSKPARKAIKKLQQEAMDRVHDVWKAAFTAMQSPDDLLRFLEPRRAPH